MDYLINLIKEKAGVTDEQAKAAAEAVVADLKNKFPQFLHPELDKIADGGDFGDATKKKLEELRDKVEETAKQVGSELREKFNEFFGPKK
jgi:hypothetical protein